MVQGKEICIGAGLEEQYRKLLQNYVPANPTKTYKLYGFPDAPPFDQFCDTQSNGKQWCFTVDNGTETQKFMCDVIVDSEKNLAKAKWDEMQSNLQRKVIQTAATTCNAPADSETAGPCTTVPRGGMINEMPLTMPVRDEIAETLSVYMTEMRSDNTLTTIMSKYSHPESELCQAPSPGAAALKTVDMASAFMVYLFCFGFAVLGMLVKHTCWMWTVQFLYLRSSRGGKSGTDEKFDEYLPNTGDAGAAGGPGEVQMKSKGEKDEKHKKHHHDEDVTTELVGAIQILTAKLARVEARSERLEAKLDRLLGSDVGKAEPEHASRLLQQSSIHISTPNGGLLGAC